MHNFEDETHFYPLKNGDPHYEAIGRVASAWSFFDFHINRLIWHLSSIDDERGACVTSNMVSTPSRVNSLTALLELECEIHAEPKLHDGRFRQDSLLALTKKLRDMARKRIHPHSQERNRIVHDTWMYGKTTGLVAQIRATADKRLDYGFRAANIDWVNQVHRKILRLDQDFELLAAQIRARIALLRQSKRLGFPTESSPPN